MNNGRLLLETKRQRRLFYGYAVTAAGFTVWLIGLGTYSPSFSLFLKPLVNEFGWSRAETSLAYSLAFVVQATLGIMIGWLTDRLGPRFIVTVMGSSLGLCFLLLSRIQSLWQFQLVYVFLGGLGASTLNVPIMATISRWFYRKRVFMIAVVQAGLGIGGFIFPPFTAWLILSHGWRSAYVVLGLVCLVFLFAAGLVLKRDPGVVGQYPDGVEPAMDVKESAPKRDGRAATFSFRNTIRTSQFWIMMALFGSFGFCRSTFLAHFPAHVQDLGFSLPEAANVLAVLNGMSVFGRIGMGDLADRVGHKRIFMLSFTLTTLTLLWGLIAVKLWMLYVFAITFGLAWGNQAVLRFSLSSQVFGTTSLGLVFGILFFSESITSMLGTYLGGYVFDLVGNYSPVFWIAAAVSTAAILLIALVRIPTSHVDV